VPDDRPEIPPETIDTTPKESRAGKIKPPAEYWSAQRHGLDGRSEWCTVADDGVRVRQHPLPIPGEPSRDAITQAVRAVWGSGEYTIRLYQGGTHRAPINTYRVTIDDPQHPRRPAHVGPSTVMEHDDNERPTPEAAPPPPPPAAPDLGGGNSTFLLLLKLQELADAKAEARMAREREELARRHELEMKRLELDRERYSAESAARERAARDNAQTMIALITQTQAGAAAQQRDLYNMVIDHLADKDDGIGTALAEKVSESLDTDTIRTLLGAAARKLAP
jgi:hypothetical protein